MTTDRTTKTLLILIAVALWGIVLRPIFVTQSAKAQFANSAIQRNSKMSAPLKPPTLIQAQPGLPYLVLSEGHISVWYVDVSTQSDKLDSKTITAEKIMKGTVLICADSKPLPTD